jgi:hypothetical protein
VGGSDQRDAHCIHLAAHKTASGEAGAGDLLARAHHYAAGSTLGETAPAELPCDYLSHTYGSYSERAVDQQAARALGCVYLRWQRANSREGQQQHEDHAGFSLL